MECERSEKTESCIRREKDILGSENDNYLKTKFKS
jgi:hypothetical protein